LIDARLDRVIPSPSIPAAVPPRTAEYTGVIGSDRIERLLLSPALMTSIVLLGAALRVWAYASNTSLYLDEILLTRNILDLPVSHLLTQPLLLDQVSPRGFLLVERLAVMIFGQGELALRLFPFVCAVVSVILFRRLAERTLTGAGPALSLLLFAIGVPFIRFGADVKPYEVDVAAAIGLLLLALDMQERETSTKCLLLWGIVGFVVVWFSQASVLMMAGLGFGLALDWLISRDRRTTRPLAITIPLWAAGCVVALLVGLRSMTPATRQFMHDFWAGGFLPLPLRLPAALRWLWDRWTSLLSDPTLLRYSWPEIFVVVALVGVVALWSRRRPVALLLLGPLVVCMAAAIAHQYPFRGRLVVWLLPSLLLAVAAGAEWMRRRISRLHPAFGWALVIVLVVPSVRALAAAPPPYEIEHHRDLLSYLQKHRRPGDLVYVLQLQQIGTTFYGPRYGLMPGEWTTGVCDENETRAYIKDVDRYRGVPRLWVLSGSGRPLRPVHAAVRSYLSTIGVKRDSLSFASLTLGSVSIELYDLSDPTRLRAATADIFPVPPVPTDPRPGCREWTRPDFGSPSR
jgi:hypothetical protein